MQELIELDDREYFYLNERFDIMSGEDVKEIPRYIVSSRKEKLRAIVRTAVENELDGTQRDYTLDKYFRGLNISQIAAERGVSRQSVYRALESAEKKLYNSLKYAYLCGFSLLVPDGSFGQLIKFLNKGEVK